MSEEKRNPLHVSLEEVSAYKCDFKPMPDGKPFDPQEHLDPVRRSAGRALRHVQGGEAKRITEEVIKKAQQKR